MVYVRIDDGDKFSYRDYNLGKPDIQATIISVKDFFL